MIFKVNVKRYSFVVTFKFRMQYPPHRVNANIHYFTSAVINFSRGGVCRGSTKFNGRSAGPLATCTLSTDNNNRAVTVMIVNPVGAAGAIGFAVASLELGLSTPAVFTARTT